MRKHVFGRQFKRDKNERKALFKTLLSSLVMYESIQISEARAKAIKADADKLITKAKKGGLNSYRMLAPQLSTEAVKKIITTIAPRFMNRQGGYTRIYRVGKRLKDNAQEVILEWSEKEILKNIKREPDGREAAKNVKKETKVKTVKKNDDKKAAAR